MKICSLILVFAASLVLCASSMARSRWPVVIKKGPAVSVKSAPVAVAEPSPATAIDRKRMVSAHNRWRVGVGVAGLHWSDALEKKAAAWAKHLKEKNRCQMKHSGPGENLYWASALRVTSRINGRVNKVETRLQAVSEERAVDSWGSEKQWYSYQSNNCRAPAGQSCGHYTQMVWQGSHKVGCARDICPDNSQIWVCEYDPPGNIIGRRPY